MWLTGNDRFKASFTLQYSTVLLADGLRGFDMLGKQEQDGGTREYREFSLK